MIGILTNPMDVVIARLMTQQVSSKSKISKDILKTASTLWESRIGPTMASSLDMSSINAVGTLDNIPYKGMVDCISRMAREEGVGAFFAGVGARVVWIAPFTAISLSLNEAFRRSLIHQRQKRREVGVSFQLQTT